MITVEACAAINKWLVFQHVFVTRCARSWIIQLLYSCAKQ